MKRPHPLRFLRRQADTTHFMKLGRIPESKRREIVSVFWFFVIAGILVSLLSYNPEDPSMRNATGGSDVRNLIGLPGSHFADLIIGLFGPAALLIPAVLFLCVIHYYSGRGVREILTTAAGGVILIAATSGLLALGWDDILLSGQKIRSGGLVGTAIKGLLTPHTGNVGGTIVFLLLWNVGFILATGVSAPSFAIRLWEEVNDLFLFLKTRSNAIRDGKTTLPKLVLKKATPKGPAPIPDERPGPFVVLPTETESETTSETESEPTSEMTDEKRADKPNVAVARPASKGFSMPSDEFLDMPAPKNASAGVSNLQMQSKLLENKLGDFGVQGKVVSVIPGPVITTFEYKPAPGVKINKIVNLTDDLALALRAMSIRIVAPIPGKAVIGIEIPNAKRETVRFREVVTSDEFKKSKSKLTICLGKDIVGNAVVAELDRMPHLLMAGATGAGKSVSLNSIICSLLYKSSPDEVKLMLIDPKRIELSIYDEIPHLIAPVVTDAKVATAMLFKAVNEMDRRYELLSQKKVRNISQYNRKIRTEKQTDGLKPIPYIVIIIDELADLMMVASRNVEFAMMRLAQMARAAGIHLIFATQRPSVNVLTGVIKANFPTRMSFQVSSKIDSRTIIDANGAESLLGNGDMLFQPPGTARLQRIHGAYISEDEIIKITDFLKSQKRPEYDDTLLKEPETNNGESDADSNVGGLDEKYDEAVAFVTEEGKATVAMIQRKFKIGYRRASKILDQMETEGVVGPADGGKPRNVLVQGYNAMP